MNRDRALDLILSLQAVVDRPGTPAEGEAAQGRIDALREKYQIPVPQKRQTKTGPTRKERDAHQTAQQYADMMRRMAEQAQRAKAQKERDATPQPGEDMFDAAQRADGRTAAEKQADLNASFGQRQRHGCQNPETFYDQGGQPRTRNMHRAQCDRCKSWLSPGEGTIFKVGPQWVARCCERVPGPRRKRPGKER